MKLRTLNRYALHVKAQNWLKHQNAYRGQLLELPESYYSQAYLMHGEVISVDGTKADWKELNGIQSGDQILFQALDRDNNPNCEPIEKQKFLEDGEYMVWIHAVLAKLDV